MIGNNWSVADSTWFNNFYETFIVGYPFAWFGISIVTWVLIIYICYYIHNKNIYIQQGITIINLKINKKIYLYKIRDFFLTKTVSAEEHNYDHNSNIIKITYIEKNKKLWGGTVPSIIIEYDDKNSYLLNITISYNKRLTKPALALTSEELRVRIMTDLSAMSIWDVKGEDRSALDLAADKRNAIDNMLMIQQQQEEEGGEGGNEEEKEEVQQRKVTMDMSKNKKKL